MVEFALVLPVLLLILIAIMKFGLMFNRYITLTDAVRSGARQLALGRGLTDPCTPARTQTVTAAGAINLPLANVTATLTSPDACGNGTSGAVMIQGDQAKITATYSCDLSVMGINFLPNCTLSASATEAIE